MEMDKLNEYLQIAIDKTVFFLARIIAAGIILWIGFKIVKKLVQWVGVALEKIGFSETLRPFLTSTTSVVLKGAVLFIITSFIGANLTGLVAILTAAGFAVGMAWETSHRES
jgi:small conductance mechanosensitive channel